MYHASSQILSMDRSEKLTHSWRFVLVFFILKKSNFASSTTLTQNINTIYILILNTKDDYFSVQSGYISVHSVFVTYLSDPKYNDHLYITNE